VEGGGWEGEACADGPRGPPASGGGQAGVRPPRPAAARRPVRILWDDGTAVAGGHGARTGLVGKTSPDGPVCLCGAWVDPDGHTSRSRSPARTGAAASLSVSARWSPDCPRRGEPWRSGGGPFAPLPPPPPWDNHLPTARSPPSPCPSGLPGSKILSARETVRKKQVPTHLPPQMSSAPPRVMNRTPPPQGPRRAPAPPARRVCGVPTVQQRVGDRRLGRRSLYGRPGGTAVGPFSWSLVTVES